MESFKDSSGSQLYDVWIIDGHYGWSTKSAVRKFQKENNLTVDGAPGSNTIKAILWKLEGTSSNQHGNILGEADTSSEQSPTLTEAPKVDINTLGSWEGQNFVFKQWIEKKDQQGTYIELDGKKYYAYKEGMNGLGYENGIWRVYLGEWKNDGREWKWTLIWADGDRYEWEYKNGKREWKWTLIKADRTKYKQIYKDNELKRSRKIIF